MPNVEVAARILPPDMVGVLRQAGAVSEVPIRANVVERMGIGVTRYHAQPVEIRRDNRRSRPVEGDLVDVPNLENLAAVRELRLKGLQISSQTNDESREPKALGRRCEAR